MAKLHYTNEMLPDSEKAGLNAEFATSLASVDGCLDNLERSLGDTADNAAVVVSRVVISVGLHLKLKHALDPARTSRLVKLLMQTYFEKKLGFDQKVKILEMASSRIRRKHVQYEYVLNDWRKLWEEALDFVTRDNIGGSTCNSTLVGTLVVRIVSFLHDARNHIPAGDVEALVAEAHDKLKDTTNMQNTEGLLLLINCLPTAYANYDAAVPVWVKLWTRISHNSMWDCLWLTLLCRARKHTRTYDWSQLSSLFCIKARELVGLPSIHGKKPMGSRYPMTMPHMFASLVPSNVDAQKVGLNKLAKLMYSLTLVSKTPVMVDASILTPPKLYGVSAEDTPRVPGFNAAAAIRPGALEVVLFVQTMRTFLYPSNAGAWTPLLAYYLTTLVSEMARHVGRNLSHTLFDVDGATQRVHGMQIFEAPVHIVTIRFLSGYLASTMMECLYGKNNMMTDFASKCLKNLCGMDPTLGLLVVPFLLGALDPQAVNQSHQAPIAMRALSDSLTSLLYPCPVVLQYLPELLRLSLPGVDANDAIKSCATLQMYSNLFEWLQVKKVYIAPQSTSYPPAVLSMLSSEDELDSDYKALFASLVNEKKVQPHYNKLAVAVEDWAVDFLNKIFEVVESQDELKKDQKSPAINGYINNCIEHLFQACSWDKASGYALRTRLENKIVDYYHMSTPLNAGKISSKILATVTEFNPECTTRLLAGLLGPDILDGTCSSKKLAFRIRCCTGAIRCTSSQVLSNLETLRPFFTPKYLMHVEKDVRESALKLFKNALRSVISSYPSFNVDAALQENLNWEGFNQKELLIGSPTRLSQKNFHQPTAADLSTMAALIRDTAGVALEELRSQVVLLTTTSMDTNDASESKDGGAIKKAEERLQQLFLIVRACMRAAAEISGDGDNGSEGQLAAKALFDEHVDDEKSVSDDDEPPVTDMVAALLSGRTRLVAGLSEQDRNLYANLRIDVMHVLTDFGYLLTGHGATDGPIAQVRNSSGFVECWLQLLEVVVNQRMAFLKDIENTKNWFWTEASMKLTMVTRTMRRGVKMRTHGNVMGNELALNENNKVSPYWRNIIGKANYWFGSQLSFNTLQISGWLQYVIRMHQLSFLSIRKCVQPKHPSSRVFGLGIYQLARLCQHEYDAIRSKALAGFFRLHSRFGKHAMIVIQKLLRRAISGSADLDPNQVYSHASGVFNLSCNPLVARKIARKWEFTETFLNAVANSHQVISNVPDQGKREILSNFVSNAFAQYTKQWGHLPFFAGKSADALLKSSLQGVGYELNGTIFAAEAGEGDRGMRFEAYAGFTVLHLIGHDDIPAQAGVWTWAIRTLATAHGQPSQILALAALSRLCIAANGTKAKPTVMDATILHEVQKCLAFTGDSSLWNGILTGLSNTHYKGGDDAPQWSRGVEFVLHAASPLRSNIPRKDYIVIYDRNVLSGYYTKENSHMIYIMFERDFLQLTEANVCAMFDATQKLPSGSEDESRSSNATRAEVFAGVLRAVSLSKTVASSEAALIVQRLMKALQDAADTVSLEYLKDWAEALTAGLAAPKNAAVKPLIDTIVKDFSTLLTSSKSESVEGDEGFSHEGKKLILANALLIADISSAVASKTECAFVPGICDIIEQAGASVISAYRTSRTTMACILGLVIDVISADRATSLVKAILQTAGHASVQEEEEEMKVVEVDAVSSKDVDSAEKDARNALDLLCDLAHVIMQLSVNIERVRTLQPLFLSRLLVGAGNPHLETAKECHDSCLLLCQGYTAGKRIAEQSSTDVIACSIEALVAQAKHRSWHVRETVQLCLAAFMVNGWTLLTDVERKKCKDVFAEAFTDKRPEIQKLACLGLVGYLSNKTTTELKTFSEAFVRNSDKYVVIERRKRQEAKNTDLQKAKEDVDPKFLSTVMMMSCIVLAFPYDLPVFMPALVSSLVQHMASPAAKDTISRTVLEFKRTHQDRWEEFKVLFTQDQLDSLISASQISYFS